MPRVQVRRDVPALADRVAGQRTSAMRELLALTARPEILSFAGGLPAPEIFDVDGLRSAFAQALTWPAAGRNLQYSTSEGLAVLRERLAQRLTVGGLPTVPAQLLVSTGSQQALTLMATVLLDPGERILVQDPTYLSALQSFGLLGGVAVPVDGDGDGIRPDALEAAIERESPRAVYLQPTFSNPTGLTLSAARRAELCAVLAEHDVWLVEDDPYSQLRWSGSGAAPMSADPRVAHCAIYLGTFSKIGCPGLRVGWVRAPEPIMPTLATVKQALDMHTSTVDQAAAAIYLEQSDLDGHIEQVRHVYRERRDAMLAAMPETMPEGSTWTIPDGGMFLWVTLPDGYDAVRELEAAMAQGVAYVPGVEFHAGRPDRRTLRMCFVTHEPAVIAEGMARLARALHRRG
jgi:DNA-binding transcriptional MocR family regulator